jgi:hypothetical protein
MAALYLIVHFDNVFSSSRDDPPRIEHHAGDAIVVGVGIVDGACPEVPYLWTG